MGCNDHAFQCTIESSSSIIIITRVTVYTFVKALEQLQMPFISCILCDFSFNRQSRSKGNFQTAPALEENSKCECTILEGTE